MAHYCVHPELCFILYILLLLLLPVLESYSRPSGNGLAWLGLAILDLAHGQKLMAKSY